jgi:hypothetical protein
LVLAPLVETITATTPATITARMGIDNRRFMGLLL